MGKLSYLVCKLDTSTLRDTTTSTYTDHEETFEDYISTQNRPMKAFINLI